MKSRKQDHNKEVRYKAEYRAGEMKVWPSPLEERMKVFLDGHHVFYEMQKIFYIYADDGYIIRYYIADFYIPVSNLIIEVDGKFHDKQKQHDKIRTRNIKESYPGIDVVRYTWGDLSDKKKMNELLERINEGRSKC